MELRFPMLLKVKIQTKIRETTRQNNINISSINLHIHSSFFSMERSRNLKKK